MSKKDIISISIVLLIALATALYFFRDVVRSVDGDPWMFVPANVTVVVEMDHPEAAFNRFQDGNDIGTSLQSVAEIQDLVASKVFLDSLMVEAPATLAALFERPMLVAWVFDSIELKSNMLVVSSPGTYIDLTELQFFLGQQLGSSFAILETEIAGKTVLKIISGPEEEVRYLGYFEGNLLYTASQQLLTQAIESGKSGSDHFTKNPRWQQFKATTGKHVDGRIYLQYKQLAPWLASVSGTKVSEKVLQLAEFADWTETDLMIKQDELLLAGFTSSPKGSFLEGFSGQQPVTTDFFYLTPFNANLILSLGFSDFNSWFANQHSPTELANLNVRYNFEMEKLISVVGAQVALVSNAETSGSYNGSSWVLIHTSDKTKMAAYLRRIAENTGKTKVNNYNNHVINCIVGKTFLADLFGSVFPSFDKNYFTLVDDYVVFAESEPALINLLRYYETGKTIDLNDNFKAFSDNLATQSNVLLYFKPGDLMGRSTDYVNEFTSRKLQILESSVSQIQGISFQFANGTLFSFTNFYLKQATEVREENLAMWKVNLDNNIINKPILVNNHRDDDQNILVFDDSPAVYLINSDGKILWRQKLSGVPFGDIYEVDYYKNGKVQYLFNTRSHIYLLDIEGHSVASYPKKLHLEATNPISVFDYSGHRDYRVLVAQADKTVNNFGVDGREVDGWNNPHMQNIVNEPVSRLVINGKDYIIITDIDGKAKIVDRQGKERISVGGKFTKARNSSYYINRTNSKGIIITTNTEGKLVYISASGRIKTTDFGNFSPDHFFLYEDFNGDGTMDFIYVDGRELKVFDRFKKVLFQYTFNTEITLKPEFFSLSRKEKVMGVVANTEKTIYLFDSKGNTIISTGLVGETPFTVGSLGNDRKINLISAAGNTLYNYRLK